jgi:hypothetical protein
MVSSRDTIIFFAGAESFHAICHGMMYWKNISVDMGFMIVTPTFHFWGILINAAIAAGLLWWTYRS